MCGRFEVDKALVDSQVFASWQLIFKSIQNLDQQPGQEVVCLHYHHGEIKAINAVWGIRPVWSDHVIFNAKSETVEEKKTFSSAYALHRCIVPCSAWFEWSGEVGHKTKHRFSHQDGSVLYIAGILMPDKAGNVELVTLTCEADVNCGIYHHRMPLLIKQEKLKDWLMLPQSQHELQSFHDLHAIEIQPPIA